MTSEIFGVGETREYWEDNSIESVSVRAQFEVMLDVADTCAILFASMFADPLLIVAQCRVRKREER